MLIRLDIEFYHQYHQLQEKSQQKTNEGNEER